MMGRQLRSIVGAIGGVVVLPAVAGAAEGWPAIAAGWTDRGTGGGQLRGLAAGRRAKVGDARR